jgi:hypothetical protein
MSGRSYRLVLLGIVCLLAAKYSAAEDGGLCCFLDPFVGLFKSFLGVFGIATTTSTTTSTSTTTYSTTVTTTTSSTTTTTEATTTTRYTTCTTTTTLSPGRCNSYLDCPEKIVEIKCRGKDKNYVTEETTIFYCTNAGTDKSMCKGNTKAHTLKICPVGFKCVEGNPKCVEK